MLKRTKTTKFQIHFRSDRGRRVVVLLPHPHLLVHGKPRRVLDRRKNGELLVLLQKWSIPSLFFFILVFSIQLAVNIVQYKFCRWVDSNLRPLYQLSHDHCPTFSCSTLYMRLIKTRHRRLHFLQ